MEQRAGTKKQKIAVQSLEYGKCKGFSFLAIFILVLSSCNSENHYFDVQGNPIKRPIGYQHLKYNLFKDNLNNLYIECPNSFFYAGKEEEILMKTNGILLQDLIEVSDVMATISSVIDIDTYVEIDSMLLYKDKNHVYYNWGTEYVDYPVVPFQILNISAEYLQVLDGGYIKDDNVVYFYGGVRCCKVENANAQAFKVITLTNTFTNNPFYLGVDDKHFYRGNEYESLEGIQVVSRKVVDSLKVEYNHINVNINSIF